MEEIKKVFPKIEYKLTGIFTSKFNFNNPVKSFIAKPGISNYNIDPKVGCNIDTNQFFVILNISSKIVETDETFFNSSTTFLFEMNNLKDIIEKNENNLVIFKHKEQEERTLLSLISISYSTMRGIILEKGSGTILQTEILPIIDPNVFIKKKELEKK